jgi:hypothetical protein
LTAATLSGIATGLVAWAYEELKERRKRKRKMKIVAVLMLAMVGCGGCGSAPDRPGPAIEEFDSAPNAMLLRDAGRDDAHKLGITLPDTSTDDATSFADAIVELDATESGATDVALSDTAPEDAAEAGIADPCSDLVGACPASAPVPSCADAAVLTVGCTSRIYNSGALTVFCCPSPSDSGS